MDQMHLSIDTLLDALDQRDYLQSKTLLAAWGLRLLVEPLPHGRVWRIGAFWFAERVAPLIAALHPLPSRPDQEDLVIGLHALWRRRVLEMWADCSYDNLARRLSGTLEYYAPWNYLYWGRLLVQRERTAEAGMYLLLSGLYDPAEAPLVAAFQRRYQHATANQIVGDLPGGARMRYARARFPDRVLQDFAAMPSPAWLYRRVPWPAGQLRLAADHCTPIG